MGKSANRSKHGYLQVSKEKINQPSKQLRLTQMSQQTDALFESDDSFEEVAAASLPVAATTCQISAVSGPTSNTRPNPTKRRNQSDSEVEINNSNKLSLLKNEQRWIFVDSPKILVITPTSDYWLEGVDFIQRSTRLWKMLEGQKLKWLWCQQCNHQWHASKSTIRGPRLSQQSNTRTWKTHQ